jgi:hypothetical protein
VGAGSYPLKAQLLVPYISQFDNIPVGFSFSRACGVTSVAMVLAYYGRVAPLTITGMDDKPTDYGYYIDRAYRYKSTYHNIAWDYFASQEQRPGLQGWGAWGFIWRNGTDKTNADVLPFLAAHDISGEIIWRPSKTYVQQRVIKEINSGHPIMANSDIVGGHYMVIYGYDATGSEFKYLVNDPWNGRMVYTFEQLKITQPYRGLIPTWPTNNFTAEVPYSPSMTGRSTFVKPLFGSSSTTTTYTYELPVVVPEKVTPAVTVYVDGRPFKMQLVYGTSYNGTYQYKTSLKPGVHSYYFSISTPHYTVWLPPDSGVWGTTQRITHFNGPFIDDRTNVTSTTIELQVMNDKYLLNGKTNFMDMPPIIKNGRTLLPISYVVSALGGKSSWDPQAQKVTVTMPKTSSATGITIEMQIGSPIAYLNGTKRYIDAVSHDVTPLLANSRTMVPLRFVAEAVGATISFDNSSKVITVNYGKD